MADITIQNLRVAPSLGPRVPTTLRAYPRSNFLLNDSDHSAVTESSPHNSGPHFKSMALTLESTLYYGAADFTLPSTTDSPDNPTGARWGLAVMDANGRFMYWAAGLESFALDHTDATQDAEDIVAYNLGGLPAAAPHDVTITGDLDVGGDLTVGGDGTFGGDVTADNFIGNGSQLTGIGVGTSTGHSAAASLTFQVDSDNNGSGILDEMTGPDISRRMSNDGTQEFFYTVTGPLRDKGGQVYNVKAYGVVGDGTANDTAALQALIDAVIVAGGGVIFLPPGTYKVSALTIEGDKVWLVGSGCEVTTITTTSATTDTITIGASGMRKGVAIKDIGFASTVTRTAGAAIFAANFLKLRLDGLMFTAPWDAIVLGQAGNLSYNPIVTNIEPAQGLANGSKNVFLKLLRVLDGQFSNITIIALANTKGIWLEGGNEGHQFVNVHVATGDDVTVQTQGQGLLINNTLNPGGSTGITPARYNRFTNCLFDLFYVNAYIIDGQQNHFSNCWFGGAKGPAGLIHGVTGGAVSDAATGNTFSGGQAHNNNKNGVQVYGVGSVSFSGFSVFGNNRLMAASSIDTAGMVLDMDALGTATVTGCIISKDMQGHSSQEQHHGIWITNRDPNMFFSIIGNILYQNTTKGINNLNTLGGGHIIRGNIGFATESSGTGTVASGATTAIITHNLSLTPAAADIQITPTNFSTNNVRYRVSAVSSTTFTVETSGDPGASGFAFSWAARVQ